MAEKIRIGISSCLLGERVRYDGGHKLDPFLRDTLGRFVQYVPVCPEVECGLPVPREAMRLEGDPAAPRLVTARTRVDLTERMLAWARGRVKELEREELCGFIFKANSPSSGMERVKLYDRNGVPAKRGVGIFARTFMEHFPNVPVEEEGRLHDVGIRENFIERIFTMKRWRDLIAAGTTRRGLVDFHTRHKLLLMAHAPKCLTDLGRVVAALGSGPIAASYDRYFQLLCLTIALRATVKKHVNVLQHIVGYFKKQLTADEKRELLDTIGAYGAGHVPLLVPLTLVNHYVRKFDEPYLKGQLYLNPHPIELQLRTHV